MSEEIHFLEDGYYVDKLEKENQQLKEDYKRMKENFDSKVEVITKYKEVIEKISNNILNETTTFCESCVSKDCCPEEDCVLYRIEKLVDKDSDK